MPQWRLAQLFRLRTTAKSTPSPVTATGPRRAAWKFTNELLPDLESLSPLINRTGLDSSSMDNMLELLVTGGMDLFRGLRMIIPPAWQNVETMDPDLRAFYEFNSMHMEPWMARPAWC